MNQSQVSESKRKYWKEKIEKSNHFSGSNVEFCKKEEISFHSFWYWKQKFSKEKNALIPESSFSRVVVEDSKAEDLPQMPKASWLAEFVIELHRRSLR